jgi:hypothetical protein
MVCRFREQSAFCQMDDDIDADERSTEEIRATVDAMV